jgi:hypothetical protein
VKLFTRHGTIFLFLIILVAHHLGAQEIDVLSNSVCKDPSKKPFLNNIFQQAKSSILRNPDDTCCVDPEDQVLNSPNEIMFTPFKGKIIRYIYVTNLGFERSFVDTSTRITSIATRLASHLHRDSREWVIRNNMFQKEGEILDPYIMADNERYLRTLDYLQDARILVRSTESPDSVDLFVVVRDVFSIKAVLDNDGFSNARVRLSESNFLGMGQRIQGTFMVDPHRSPMFGAGFEYNKNNIGGSFIHLNLAYSQIDQGPSLGFEPEKSIGFSLDRPLFASTAAWAGALKLSKNTAVNVYGQDDSLWENYSYNLFDIWGGYNLSLGAIRQQGASYRNREFLSLRYYQQKFTDGPAYFGERFDPIYNDRKAVLGQLTFFRQNFIKTQYIYGFGITEDVPKGYNMSFTGGWYEQLNLSRPYAGLSVDYFTAKSRGSFCQYYLRAGAFLNGGNALDDAALLLGVSWFSPLYFGESNTKIRLYIRATYARVFDPLTYEPLRINNVYGLRDFGTDSAQGFERISFQTENVFFLRRKILGFRMAPFVYADGALLRGDASPMYNAQFYPGFGGGLRTRNEALIWGTIEFKACIFPRTVVGQPAFKFLIASDLKYRYSTTYIKPPDIIRLNSE